MKFSILIANFNYGIYFKDCYDSLLKQTYTNWEAIILDDGSIDNSVQCIQNLIQNDDRFKLYTYKIHKGCGFAKSECVRNATGSLAGFLDADDALAPDALQTMVDTFMQYPDVVLVHSTLMYCDEKLKPTHPYKFAHSVPAGDNFFFNINHCITAFTAFKINAYKKTQGIDTYLQRAVDQDLYLKLYEAGSFQFVDKCLYYYRKHSSSVSTNMEKGRYWFWFVIMQAAKRRNINVENLFQQHFISRKSLSKLHQKLASNKVYMAYTIILSIFKKMGALYKNK